MDEEAVVARVTAWTKHRYPTCSVAREKVQFIDLSAISISGKLLTMEDKSLTEHVQIECKGTQKAKSTTMQLMYSALGQTLTYYITSDKIPTFLAVPTDYKKLETLKRVIEELDLPIGLLLVPEDGELLVMREARGTPWTRTLSELATKASK